MKKKMCEERKSLMFEARMKRKSSEKREMKRLQYPCVYDLLHMPQACFSLCMRACMYTNKIIKTYGRQMCEMKMILQAAGDKY